MTITWERMHFAFSPTFIPRFFFGCFHMWQQATAGAAADAASETEFAGEEADAEPESMLAG
mgnify:CR=1 FL=1